MSPADKRVIERLYKDDTMKLRPDVFNPCCQWCDRAKATRGPLLVCPHCDPDPTVPKGER